MGELAVQSNGGTQSQRSVPTASKGLNGRQVKPWIELMGAVGLLAVGVTLLVLAVILGRWGLPQKELWKSLVTVVGMAVLVVGGVSGPTIGFACAGCAIKKLRENHAESRETRSLLERMDQAKKSIVMVFSAL